MVLVLYSFLVIWLLMFTNKSQNIHFEQCKGILLWTNIEGLLTFVALCAINGSEFRGA